jgi:hypothetical protein
MFYGYPHQEIHRLKANTKQSKIKASTNKTNTTHQRPTAISLSK